MFKILSTIFEIEPYLRQVYDDNLFVKLDEEKKKIRLLALLDTLEYLKKGGRISAATAFAGGLLAILVTILLRKFLTKKQLWVAGIFGAIAHSIGQVAMAIAITATPGLIIYLPWLCVISIVTGLFTGLCAQFLVNREGNLWKISSK